MTKKEFQRKIKSEKINTGEYIIVLDNITDEPLVMGCAFDDGVWKIYETMERGGHFIIKELDNENQAFDYFYELLLSRHNYLSKN
ncbi:hypothetical protein WMZ97_06075 [Lentibacillus sp. N15]|uniref:hypothetical protein n=1 Tax=Lentibacillus songyuanensis TaxID=3136161 RepID=UPI0031BA4E03